ncbi:MAG: hypothetical protein ACREFQ_21190 [Stellaceae bacterium]
MRRRPPRQNAIAVLIWACIWGGGTYWLGQASTGLLERLGIAIFVVVSVIPISGWIYFRRHEDEFEARADHALPGPLRSHRPSGRGPGPSAREPAGIAPD